MPNAALAHLATILVAEAQPEVRTLVKCELAANGFAVTEAQDGEAALALARELHPELAILAQTLPRVGGFEICRVLRSDPACMAVRIIMLGQGASEADCIVAYELGADDYVSKPFSARELALRVKAILRSTRPPVEDPGVVRQGAIVVDPERHTVHVHGRPVALSATEFRLLLALMQAGGKVKSRAELMRELRGDNGRIEQRSVDTQVRRLRDKLGRAGEQIQTVRSFGYRFSERL